MQRLVAAKEGIGEADMHDTLLNIRENLKQNVYQNEEHVRWALVARLLQQLGWDIWNPREVNAEYKPVPHEDKTKVDFALFSKLRKPDVFLEVKAVNGIMQLADVERQMRDYNRDNTALFCVITDGRKWYFYLSQTAGRFSDKRFTSVDLLNDELDEIGVLLRRFLEKSRISSGEAVRDAQEYLKLTEIQRLMQDLLPQARKAANEPPYPRLPEALVNLVAEHGHTITVQEAVGFIEKPRDDEEEKEQHEEKQDRQGETKDPEKTFPPESPPSLYFTKIMEARFGSRAAGNWNSLLRCAIEMALRANLPSSRLTAMSIPVVHGQKTDNGYSPLANEFDMSMQNVDANKAWQLTLRLAKELRTDVRVRFVWRDKEGAAHPGKEAVMEWKP